MRRIWKIRYCFALILIILWMWSAAGCSSEKEEMTELSEISVSSEEERAVDTEEGQAESLSGKKETIFVHVCGEVRSPGVYELSPDSRIYEALEAAGGMTETAAFTYLNQAEKVSDGQQVYVPSKEETLVQGETPGEIPNPDDGKISLNTASKEELTTLPGIGEVKAEAIIRYREDKGGFASIEELKEIEGIKEGVFNKVKDLIKI